MSFLSSVWDTVYDTFIDATVDDYVEAVREYACPAVTGAVLFPLAFATGGTGIVAVYTANMMFAGAGIGMVAHHGGFGGDLIRGVVEHRAGMGNPIPDGVYERPENPPVRQIPPMRERPVYYNYPN